MWGRNSPADVLHFDAVAPRGRFRPNFGIMIVAVRPDACHSIPNFFRRRPAAEHRTDVVAPVGKKAKKQSPFHRESGTGAVTAKRLRYGTDEADFTRAVQIAPTLGHFPAVQRLRRRNRPHLVNPAHDFRGRHHVIHSPTVGGARVHVFMPRFTTVFTLTGSPASQAARIPLSTSSAGNPTSLMA